MLEAQKNLAGIFMLNVKNRVARKLFQSGFNSETAGISLEVK